MESEKKKIIYDNVKIGVRGLTAIILLGIFIMTLLIAYGYLSA